MKKKYCWLVKIYFVDALRIKIFWNKKYAEQYIKTFCSYLKTDLTKYEFDDNITKSLIK